MASQIDPSTVYELVPSGNLTSLADELKPTGEDILDPMQQANSSWQGLSASFQATGLEDISALLNTPESEAEDFKEGIESGATALTSAETEFSGLETDRSSIMTRIPLVNQELTNAERALDGMEPDDDNYDTAQTRLTNAEEASDALVEEITQFNKAVETAEENLATALTGISTGTEVSDTGGSTGMELITEWDGSVGEMRDTVLRSNDPSFIERLGEGAMGLLPGADNATGGVSDVRRYASWTSSWMIYFGTSEFKPNPRGRHVRTEGLTRAQRGQMALPRDLLRSTKAQDARHWQAKPGQEAAHSRWKTAGKWVGRAGTALGFVTGGVDQWSQDNGAGYNTSERVGRTATRSVAVGAGGWGGAVLGAKGGAIVGSFFGPAGTVIGGVVGGVVGGVIGSGVGNKIADKAVDAGGKAVDFITFWD